MAELAVVPVHRGAVSATRHTAEELNKLSDVTHELLRGGVKYKPPLPALTVCVHKTLQQSDTLLDTCSAILLGDELLERSLPGQTEFAHCVKNRIASFSNSYGHSSSCTVSDLMPVHPSSYDLS
jgi:hypothetical protein